MAHFASHPQLAARLAAAQAAEEASPHVTRPLMSAGRWRALQQICGPSGGDGGPGVALAPLEDPGGSRKGPLPPAGGGGDGGAGPEH